MKAGAATVDITPAAGTPMAGFAARTRPAASVHDRLTARAVAVSDGGIGSIVVVADLLALDVATAAVVSSAVSARTGVPGNAVAVCVTHTHGGPAVAARGLGGPVDQKYVDAMVARLADVAAQAWGRMRPARLRRGRAELHAVAHNRRGVGAIDPAVISLAWDDLDGRPIAVIFSHACHPVTLGPDNLLFTADWPGPARDVVERAYGGVAVFLQGCCGQINTGHQATDSYTPAPRADRTFERAAEIGRLVGDTALAALRTAAPVGPGPVRVRAGRADLPFAPLPDDRELAAWVEDWSVRAATADEGNRAVLEMWSRWASDWTGRVAVAALRVPVAVHVWGSAGLVFLPGEPFVDLALALRAEFDDPALLVAGYAGGVPGYVPYPPDEYDRGGYEVLEAHRAYGQPAPFAPEAGTLLLEAAIDVASATALGATAAAGATAPAGSEEDSRATR